MTACLRIDDDFFLRRSADRALPKRERTRFLLMHAALHELRARHASAITVEGLIERIGISKATFYRYYPSVGHLLAAFNELFVGNLGRERPRGALPMAQSIRRANLFYCLAFAANADIFGALDHYASQNAEIFASRERLNAALTHAVVRVLGQRGLLRPQDAGRTGGLVRVLIAMTDEALRERFVRNDPTLVAQFPDAASLAAGLTHVWLRTLGIRDARRTTSGKM